MMKKIIIAAILVACTNLAFSQNKIIDPAALNIIGNDSIKTINPRTQFYTFGFAKEFQTEELSNSHFYQPLTTGWKYKLYNTKEEINSDVVNSSYDDSSWKNYTTNSQQNLTPTNKLKRAKGEFKIELPENNPAAVFRTNFKVPLTWDERQIFVSAENLSANSIIYVNGKEVGYSEDSKAISGFDITRACKEGLNNLVIISYGYSAASYLEDEELFAGLQIGGEVVVWSTPKVHMYDYIVNSTFDPTYKNGLLEVGAVIETHYLNSQEVKLFFELRDSEGNIVDSQSKYSELNMRTRDTVYFNVSIQDVKRWSASDPNLYKATIRVQREMRFTEFVTIPIGFRQIDINNNTLKVNGKAERIKGVKLAQKDIPNQIEEVNSLFSSLKNNGVNTIWITGAQKDSLYILADELGLYVFNSANINSSSEYENLRYGIGNYRFIRDKYLSRQLNNYEASKSHPSVIAFLMGLKGSNGYNMYESYILLESKKSLRPIAFQGGLNQWNSDLFLPQNVKTKDIKNIKNNAGTPTIISINDSKNFKNTWKAVIENNDVRGLFFENLDLFQSSDAAQYFVDYETSLNKETITITNNSPVDIADFTLEYTLNHDRLSITLYDFTIGSKKSPTTTGEFSIDLIKSGESKTFDIDKKIFKAVENVDIVLKDNKGYVELREKLIPTK